VIFIDIPIQLGGPFLIRNRQGLRNRSHFVSVNVLCDLRDPIQLLLADTLDHAARSLSTGWNAIEQVCAFEVFIGKEEEQFVFDNRAAERCTVALNGEFTGVDVLAFQ